MEVTTWSRREVHSSRQSYGAERVKNWYTFAAAVIVTSMPEEVRSAIVDVEPFAAESARIAHALGAVVSGDLDWSGCSPPGSLLIGEVYGVVPRLRWINSLVPAIGAKRREKECSNVRKKVWRRPFKRGMGLRHALTASVIFDFMEPPGEYVSVELTCASSALRPAAHGVAQWCALRGRRWAHNCPPGTRKQSSPPPVANGKGLPSTSWTARQ